MEIKFYYELEIEANLSKQINALLEDCFEGIGYHGRDYFKQMPHYRLIGTEHGRVIGHLGMDLRMMSIDGHNVAMLGVVDFCVNRNYRGKGMGAALLLRMLEMGTRFNHKVDGIFLVTDDPNIYLKHGFEIMDVHVKWLKIDQHQTLGIGHEKIDDAHLMVKSLTGQPIRGNQLDMLGYMY